MLPLMSVVTPANFTNTFESLMLILNLDIYNIGEDLAETIGLQKAIPVTRIQRPLELLGVESANFIENNGNLIIQEIVIVFLYLLLSLKLPWLRRRGSLYFIKRFA